MSRYFYSNVKGIMLTQLLFTLFSIFGLVYFGSLEWILLSIFVYYLTGCVGITITFHRYLSHKSFSMPKFLEYLFSFFGSMGGTGSAIGWVAVHKAHHRYSDKEGDPHCPKTLRWRIFVSNYSYDFKPLHVRKLLRDKFHVFIHRYYYPIFVAWGLFLFLLDWKIGFYGFIVPVAIQIWASNISNWGNHTVGYRNYNTNDNSKNTWWISALTWGEGWHNNHHAKPGVYTFQHKWWEFDISGYTILLIALFTGRLNNLKKLK